MINIVQTYIDVLQAEHEMGKTDIAVELSLEFDRSYDLKKLNQWLRGDTSLPRHIYTHMLSEILDSERVKQMDAAEKTVALSFPERRV